MLRTMRPGAEALLGVDFDDYREPEPEEQSEPPEWVPAAIALIEPLSSGLPAHGDDDSPDQAERRLLAHLLLYHHREGKPTYY